MISAIIITRNEQENIIDCLNALKFCPEIIVIDNNSTDETKRIAADWGARVEIFKPEGDFSAIRNYGLTLVKNEWVLYVDADEVISPQLQEEIQQTVKTTAKQGFYLSRLDILWGQELHYGDTGSVALLRLGRKNAGVWVGRVHETWNISSGVGNLVSPLLHYPHPTIDEFLKSINIYSSIRAEELSQMGKISSVFQILFHPLGKFIYLWIIKRGILDGNAGFVHAMLMAFYTFLVRSKLYVHK